MKSFPDLFSEIHKDIFRPLSSPNAGFYWQVLYSLYHLDFEGEPFEITKEAALEHICNLLENTEWKAFKEMEEELPIEGLFEKEESQVSEEETKTFARRLLKKLQVYGWFDYEFRRNKGYVLSFYDYSARLLHTLASIARKEQVSFVGLAYNVKAGLSQQAFDEKPGVALETAQKNTIDLVRELKILNQNIHRHIDKIFKEALATNDLIHLHMDVYQKNVIEANYHRFKTSDNIYKFRQFILSRMQAIKEDSSLIEKAVKWVAENDQVDGDSAREKVDEWCDMILTLFRSIDKIVSDVDRRNARYSGVTLQKINYHLHQDKLLEGQLLKTLETLLTQKLPEDEIESICEGLFEIYEVKFFDHSSLYTHPKKGEPHRPVNLSLKVMKDEKKAALLEKHRKEYEKRFTRKKIHNFALDMLGQRMHASLEEVPVENDHHFIRMIYLVSYGFEKKSPYKVELQKTGWVRKNGYEHRPGKIIKKRT